MARKATKLARFFPVSFLKTGANAETLSHGGGATFAGDLDAAGGFRRSILFIAPGAAGVTAASQTGLDMKQDIGVTFAHGYVATRAGSVVGLSASLSTAITTAGAAQTLDVFVTKNGTQIAAATVRFTTGGAEIVKYASFAKDAYTFDAGDVIGCEYTSTTISNTPSLMAHVHVEN